MSRPEVRTGGGTPSGNGSRRARAAAPRRALGAAREPARVAPAHALRDEVGEIQRARIVAGAVEAMAEGSYGGLTVTKVIARAKISRRTFYELFEDREDCFMAAFEEALAQVQAPVVEAYGSGGRSWRERVAAGLGALLDFFDEQPAFARLLVVDALAGGPAVLERRGQALAVLARVVDEGRTASKGGRDPGPLVAEGVVGAVLAVLHARLHAEAHPVGGRPLRGLLGPLMGMIVLPYLGVRAAERERERPLPQAGRAAVAHRRLEANPLYGLNMRLTYRTLRVLCAVAERPGASNRGVADGAGIIDQGQTSRLLARLRGLGLIENTGVGHYSGANAWTLTARGEDVVETIGTRRVAS
jgi:AcrR family transcriptional regulator